MGRENRHRMGIHHTIVIVMNQIAIWVSCFQPFWLRSVHPMVCTIIFVTIPVDLRSFASLVPPFLRESLAFLLCHAHHLPCCVHVMPSCSKPRKECMGATPWICKPFSNFKIFTLVPAGDERYWQSMFQSKIPHVLHHLPGFLPKNTMMSAVQGSREQTWKTWSGVQPFRQLKTETRK